MLTEIEKVAILLSLILGLDYEEALRIVSERIGE